MLYDVTSSLKDKFLFSKEYLCFWSVGRDWEYLKELLNCARMEKVQAGFPTTVLVEKGRWQEPRPQKDRLQVVLEECKAELTALCEQYHVEQGSRPPSGVVYKKVHNPVRRKLDYPSTKIRDADDLNSGDESPSESPPMGSRSPWESPLTVNGLPRECQLISFNSFTSPSQILPTTFIPPHILLFMLFWFPPFYQFTSLLSCLFLYFLPNIVLLFL